MYTSFLIRLWRETSLECPQPTTDWQSEVEHIQSGQRWTILSLDDTLYLVRLLVKNQATLEAYEPNLRPVSQGQFGRMGWVDESRMEGNVEINDVDGG
jgi:hypothetical protein